MLVYVQVQTPPVIYLEDRNYVELVCEVFGYPRISSRPVWITRGSTVPNDCRHCITGGLVSDGDISYYQKVESVLSILNMTVEDAGEYNCSISGQSSAFTLKVFSGKLKSNLLKSIMYVYALSKHFNRAMLSPS